MFNVNFLLIAIYLCFQAVFPKTGSTEIKLSKPKVTDKSRVVSATIRSSGPCVQLRMLTKNIKSITTDLVKGKKIFIGNTFGEYLYRITQWNIYEE